MVEFSNGDEFVEWVGSESRETLSVLTCRIALRAFPWFVHKKSKISGDVDCDFILKMFRLASCSGCRIFVTDNSMESNIVKFDFINYDSDAEYYSNQAYVAYATDENDASNVLMNISSAYRAAAILSAAYDTSDVNKIDFRNSAVVIFNLSLKLWVSIGELLADLRRIDEFKHYENSAMLALWPLHKEPQSSRERWLELKKYFAQFPDENWQVWIDWWEDRRDGKPYNIEMEREIVLIPDEDWERGPAHVNAMIAEIRARYADGDIPEDDPVAPRFASDAGRIVPRIDMPADPAIEEQAELHEALREQTVELRALCPEDSNRYASQGRAVAAFLTALGEDYRSMRLSALWIAAQRMRRFARADEAKLAAADPEDDPMEPDQGALFSEVVMTYNVFSTGEPSLKAKDDLGRDPATLSPDVTGEARAIRSIVAQTPALFGEAVEPLLGEVLEQTGDPVPGIAARGVVMTRGTFDNLLGAILRKARAEPKPDASEIGKGAKAALGAGIVGGSGVVSTVVGSAFVAYHEATLIAYATKLGAGPVWVAIIKKIAAQWPGL